MCVWLERDIKKEGEEKACFINRGNESRLLLIHVCTAYCRCFI